MLTAAALAGIPGEPAEYLAAGPDGVTGGTEIRSDEAVSLRAARKTGKPVQVKSLTSETTEVYALPDGQFRAELSLGPTRVRRGDGWVPIDLNLRRDPDGTIRPAAHPYDLTISGSQPSGTHELAAVGKGDDRVAVNWAGALPEPQLSADRATYVDALAGVDLVVRASRSGLETLFVVKSPAALSRVAKLSLPVTGRNVADVHRGVGGDTTIRDKTGRTIATSPALMMWDARVDAQGEPVSKVPVASTVAKAAGAAADHGFALTLTPDQKWLRAPERKYPITIDPQINPLSTTYDTYVQANESIDRGSADDLRLGKLGPTGPITRSFARWDTTALVGKQINTATISLWNWWSVQCAGRSWELWTTGAIADGIVWSNQPTWTHQEKVTTASAGFDSSCDDNYVGVSATSFFQRAADGGDTRADMGIRATDETDSTSFKQFRSRTYSVTTTVPKATVTYNSYPTVTARSTVPASTCATGPGRPIVNSVTPQLKATVADADATAMTVTFEWWAMNADAAIGSDVYTGVANGATVATTIPAGVFADGGIYRWRVKASDGVSGSDTWSSFCEMQVYTTVPPVTGCTAGTDSDFNGDGVADVAIADPEAVVNGQVRAGQLHVSYGGGATVHTLYEGVAKVPGTPEASDRFGTAISPYDANNDGCTDLAVGVPFQDVNGLQDAGVVLVLLGSPAGLAQGPATLVYHQDVTNVPDTAEAHDWFGYAVAGSRTARGVPYLVIGAPGEGLSTTAPVSGIVHYIRGTVNVAMSQGAGVPGAAEIDDRTGYAVAASKHHWAVSSPGEAIGTAEFAGAVNVYSHTLTNGLPTLAAELNQNATSVSDTSEANDNFGKSIAIAPYRPAGTAADAASSLLVVGVPGEGIEPAQSDAGMVQRFHITAGNTYTEVGPAITHNPQNPLVTGGDYLGEKVVVTNTNPSVESTNSTMFMALGLPGKDGSSGDTSVTDFGQVLVLPALVTSIGTPVVLQRNGSSLPGSFRASEIVGTSFGATSQRLLVGTPYGTDAVYGFTWASLAGGSTTPSQTWQPGVNGIPASVSTFGAAVN
ncbi:DNRLRE domain-containing protein [Micromonospora profundi]|uniref:DNRLRE domain-containing protein n=1 Tax=Micromonospora profundi TaxID=1420889 RepID=A0AAJ6L589_9ACTN|nr:DNRLRE domain-containing protein [Micromonospora profundi]WLS48960.1 DNRLRE domain-containing protein [Micromonospora profundi]